MTKKKRNQDGDKYAAARDEHFRIYEAIWTNMDRENHLINHRIMWAIVFSAGIFTASAVLVSIALGSARLIAGVLLFVMATLSGTGIFFSIRTRDGVRAAHSQLDYLCSKYVERAPTFEIEYGWPRPYGDKHDHHRGNNAARAFPELMYWTWIAAAVIELVVGSMFLVLGAQDAMKGLVFVGAPTP